MKQKNKLRNQMSGSVLVMTIIVASGIMIVSAEFALFVVGAIRQARTIDHATIALYAAESGAESGLFQIRQEKRDRLRKDTSEASDGLPVGMKWTLKNEGSTVRFRNSVDKLEKSLLKKNETIELALYKQGQQGLEGISQIESLKATWEKEENCGDVEGQRPWFEISVIEWDGGLVDWSSAQLKKVFLEPTADEKQVILDFSQVRQTQGTDRPLLVRAKALFCDVGGATITLHSDVGGTSAPREIPNYFFLAPEGIFSAISQRGNVIFPAKESSLGLFDFTVFSEEQITKK